MSLYAFETVDVFTERHFAGNPLAVFHDATGLSASQMQSLAAELNLSETTFVLPPENSAHSARVRIFHRTAEMPFAGHPMVGTGYLLARKGLDRNGVLLFEVPAGVVRVEIERSASGEVLGAFISAPQPLSLGETLPIETIAACAGLHAEPVLVTHHQPILASMGTAYVIAEVTDEALRRAAPNISEFRRETDARPDLDGRLSLFLYVKETPFKLRARMFAPLAGTYEDPATGSASVCLGGLLLSLSGESRRSFVINQGVEMGRPSSLNVVAALEHDGIRATVGGRCVPVLRGTAEV
ncbi:MAG TPA: PhzF family phenazine biosynthesis protein [Burkholderiaceae bacterium]|nr:PhzF family phenazine biosynthesis protein [Burkholderiaceae bacterium]